MAPSLNITKITDKLLYRTKNVPEHTCFPVNVSDVISGREAVNCGKIFRRFGVTSGPYLHVKAVCRGRAGPTYKDGRQGRESDSEPIRNVGIKMWNQNTSYLFWQHPFLVPLLTANYM